MFKNTGNLSFYLGIGSVVLALIWLVIVYILIARSANDADKQTRVDKVIEVGKWFFASIAIVVAATVVSDGFRERDEDIKEIAVFDKYTTIVTKADGLAERRLLVEYFAAVSPPGTLRDSWMAYKNLTDRQAEETERAIAEKAAIDATQNPTEAQKQKSDQLGKIIEIQNKPLISQTASAATASEQWLIIAGTYSSLTNARDELIKIRAVSPDAQIYKIQGKFAIVIPNFVSRDEALKRLPAIQKGTQDTQDAFVQKSFCTAMQVTEDYIACN